MTNEWVEFKAYTEQPTYTAFRKTDTTYLGRFTFDMITDFSGFGRILTIIARGYLFHDKDGAVLDGNPYDRIDTARNALCAWCSVPDKKKSSEPSVDFRELSADFPELIDENGKGWFYRHIKSVIRFVKANPDKVSKSAYKKCENLSVGFTSQWKKRVRQLQVPIFALNTKGAWTLRFDDIIADALEAGALRTEEYPLPETVNKQLETTGTNGVPKEVIAEMIRYYFANKPDDTDWVVLPVANFDAYYGNNNLSKKWLAKITKSLIQRENRHGICRYKVIASQGKIAFGPIL
ncbi:hypothetical protein [uncultured Ruminococcus sp.]|uniref:hypothetical protein n=1 Tax=uncultured Ruminococcus sp. TaxID=165186 RepID=UPI00292CBD2B|nr:hypothetical protein [uncultured Ruminococcus sp.]